MHLLLQAASAKKIVIGLVQYALQSSIPALVDLASNVVGQITPAWRESPHNFNHLILNSFYLFPPKVMHIATNYPILIIAATDLSKPE